MVAVGSKCRTCRGGDHRPAAPQCQPAPTTSWNCAGVRTKAIEHFKMFSGDPACGRGSGGKDSLRCGSVDRPRLHWADGLYVGLGIGDYSDVSAEYAARRGRTGLNLVEIKLREEYGYDIPTARATRRAHARRMSATPVRQGSGRRGPRFGDHNPTTRQRCCSATHCTGMSVPGAQLPVLEDDTASEEGQATGAADGGETAAWCIVRGIDYPSTNARWRRATSTRLQGGAQHHRGDVAGQRELLLQPSRTWHRCWSGAVADGQELGSCSNWAPTIGKRVRLRRLVERLRAPCRSTGDEEGGANMSTLFAMARRSCCSI